MATFSRPFADLSRYQQAAVQPQANVLDQFVQALNQGISLAQLPQTLQAEAQQRQQAEILNAIKVATAQKQFEELNKTPEQRLAERFQDNLIAQSYDRASGVRPLAPEPLTQEQLSIFEGGVPLAAPGALTPMQQIALEEGNVRTNVPLGAPVAPVLTPRGVPTQFSFDPTVPVGIAQQQEDARLASVEATEAAKGRGRFPSEKAKIDAQAAARGIKETPLIFSTQGNKRIGQNPFTGDVVSETIIDPAKIYRNTPAGLFVIDPAIPNDPGQIVKGTEPVKSQSGPRDYEMKVRKEFHALPNVKEFLGIKPQYDRMQAALSESKKGGSLVAVDQALINTFNKMIDPRSVVMVSEYARTARDLSLVNQLKGKMEKLVSGGAGLTSEEREAIARMAKNFYDVSKTSYDASADFYTDITVDGGGDPKRVIMPYTDIRSFNSEQEARNANLKNGTPIIVNGTPGVWGDD